MPKNLARHLVSTKFAPPRIGTRHVVRALLLAHLKRMSHCRLALITGAAGYGKTTLLAQWRQDRLKAGAEVAWVSLAVDDKGYNAFCTAFLEGVRRLGIDIDINLQREDNTPSAIDGTVAIIVNAAAMLNKELYLVVDDYHYVEAPHAHTLMQKLLEQGPANLHLVIASRVSPPLSLSRLRVMDLVVEIESAMLPFDLAETRTFVEENLGSEKINADALSLIYDLTSGWPSCLQLIVIMLKSRSDTRSILDDLVWRANDLQTYLSEEVVAHLPIELVKVAETLSLFRRFNAAMAIAVTGNAQAGELLQRMEDENLLIYRVDSDDRITWFRFHPLFGEFLSTRLQRREHDVRALHRLGAQWFAGHNCLTEAVRHANLGDDIEFAVQVIEQTTPATWSLDYLAPTLRLLERLPEEVLFRHQRLLFLACLTVSLTSRPARAKAWLSRLQASNLDAHPELASGLPLIHAAVAIQEDDSELTIRLLEPVRDAAMGNPFLRYVLLAALTVAYATAGRYTDARRLFDVHPIPSQDRNNDMALVAESARLTTYLLAGDIIEAESLASELLERSTREGGQRSICSNLCASLLADAFYELDRIDDARELIANRFGLLHSSVPDVIVRTNLSRSRLDLLQKGPDAALNFLRQQIAHLRSLGQIRPVAHLLAEAIRVCLIKGQHSHASELLQALESLAHDHGKATGGRAELPAIAALARARVLVKQDSQAALLALETVSDYAQRFQRGRLSVLTDLLSAGVLEDLKQPDHALLRAQRAVEAAQRLGLVRTLLDEGVLSEKLLCTLATTHLRAPLRQYVDELIEKLTGPCAQNLVTPRMRRTATSGQPALLTPREREILSLVAQAMSSKRIAHTLDITLETVKWNLRNIFAKLGVSSRYDAMVQARNQKLID
ncbi:LuxR C-terminal-related transcriptional regulator [Pseudomonas alkylphenolica]|uniref:LuxR C-terminal-related transcriptional regulator n=1 Tax=Pseudomonas alkylphenolica TaxID=237609 RepID=UPI0018D9A9D2|nr:LuxR C-terminal-related transcriptional regulator [Pseudomonas alkylphenolica]MBH3429652.1 helix-turn-helix transcriptional regulator [Pseudomonas alkylphenolica]